MGIGSQGTSPQNVRIKFQKYFGVSFFMFQNETFVVYVSSSAGRTWRGFSGPFGTMKLLYYLKYFSDPSNY